jgi:allantoinase
MVGAALDLVLKSRRVVTPEGESPLAVGVREGRIEIIAGYDANLEASTVHDFGDAVVLPGLCDTHVHVNEPGRTEWEGFRTATRAAAAGGITTIVDMPLNSIPPPWTRRASGKTRGDRGKLFVDVGLWGGVVPGNTPS